MDTPQAAKRGACREGRRRNGAVSEREGKTVRIERGRIRAKIRARIGGAIDMLKLFKD